MPTINKLPVVLCEPIGAGESLRRASGAHSVRPITSIRQEPAIAPLIAETSARMARAIS
jgi:hypothetical protein